MKNFVEFQNEINELKEALESQAIYLKIIDYKDVDDGFSCTGLIDMELGGPEPEGAVLISYVKDKDKFIVHFKPRLSAPDENNEPEFIEEESQFNILKGQECAKYIYNYLNK